MIKRKLFIGSSNEGKNIAERVKGIINKKFDWLEAVMWSDDDSKVFQLNSGTLDSLVKASRKFDYGILIATNDDTTNSRGKEQKSPRDNVIFEMGLFLGSLGFSRAFLLIEKNGKLLSDFNGVTIPRFENNSKSIKKAIDSICEDILKTKNSFNLKPVPSTALAIGYFDNFVNKLAKKKLEDNENFKLKILVPENLTDNIYSKINLFKNNNPSKKISIYEKDSRPVVYKFITQKKTFWDIPTTLTTLKKTIDSISLSKEIGEDLEKDEWIKKELLNFGDTLTFLIKKESATKEKVIIEYLN